MQYFTQYSQPNSRKKQIDNVDIMNAFCKTMFLLSYSFIISGASFKWRDAQRATFPHVKFIAYTLKGLT